MAESFLPLLAHAPRTAARAAGVGPDGVGESPARERSAHEHSVNEHSVHEPPVHEPPVHEPPARQPSAQEQSLRELSVLAANVEHTRRDAEAQAEALLAVAADVLLVIEATAATVAALNAAGLDVAFAHRADDPDEGHFGSLVASRHPIVAATRCDLGGRPGHIVDLDVGGATVRVVPVHTQAPVGDSDLEVWRATVAANAALADGAPGPVVLAGDWNATGGHRAFRRALAAHDLTDAQAALGRRWAPTWPVDLPRIGIRVPRVLALDHVVVSRAVAVTALERIVVPGTDHLALRARLRLPT